MTKINANKLHSNRVYLVLRHLDSDEIKRLEKFMRSPYFNQSKTLGKLCGLMIAEVEKKKPGFQKEKIWNALFPGEPFNDITFRKHNSDLMRLLEVFMATEVLISEKQRQKFDILDFLSKRKIQPLLDQYLSQSKADLESDTPYKNLDYYKKRYEVEQKVFDIRDMIEAGQHDLASVKEISDNLDVFYLISKLKLMSVSLIIQKMTGQQPPVKLMKQVAESTESFDLSTNPELAAQWYAYQMSVDDSNREYYETLKDLLYKYGHQMPQKEALELVVSTLNYCTGQVNKGRPEYLNDYLDLSEYALKHQIFIVKGELLARRYNNIVVSALRLGRLEWAEQFVRKYKIYLPESSRENSFTFNLARVYRFQKKWDQVIELLRDVEYEDVFYNLTSKTILIITYYELDEYDLLESHLDAFRVFLQRQKSLAEQLKLTYLNLIKYTRRLIRMAPGDKTGIHKLKEEIAQERATTVNHEWLTEKLDELL